MEYMFSYSQSLQRATNVWVRFVFLYSSSSCRLATFAETEIGIIGGSGLYSMAGFEAQEELNITTPFGSPSDNYVLGTLAGRNVAFLARHGRGHRLSPSE